MANFSCAFFENGLTNGDDAGTMNAMLNVLDMKRNKHHYTLFLAGLVALGLSGCVFDTEPLPEMPYRPRAVKHTPPAQPKQEEPVQSTTWEESPAPSPFITTQTPTPRPSNNHAADATSTPRPSPTDKPVTPSSSPATSPAPASRPVEQPAPAERPTQPTVIDLPPQSPAPSPTTAPAPATSSKPSTDLKQITNTGPIPTAARVEGDPTRVWNPLDPSKKIRIINPKTNQPYPSGKKLKVRGTNFQFYVP